MSIKHFLPARATDELAAYFLQDLSRPATREADFIRKLLQDRQARKQAAQLIYLAKSEVAATLEPSSEASKDE